MENSPPTEMEKDLGCFIHLKGRDQTVTQKVVNDDSPLTTSLINPSDFLNDVSSPLSKDDDRFSLVVSSDVFSLELDRDLSTNISGDETSMADDSHLKLSERKEVDSYLNESELKKKLDKDNLMRLPSKSSLRMEALEDTSLDYEFSMSDRSSPKTAEDSHNLPCDKSGMKNERGSMHRMDMLSGNCDDLLENFLEDDPEGKKSISEFDLDSSQEDALLTDDSDEVQTKTQDRRHIGLGEVELLSNSSELLRDIHLSTGQSYDDKTAKKINVDVIGKDDTEKNEKFVDERSSKISENKVEQVSNVEKNEEFKEKKCLENESSLKSDESSKECIGNPDISANDKELACSGDSKEIFTSDEILWGESKGKKLNTQNLSEGPVQSTSKAILGEEDMSETLEKIQKSLTLREEPNIFSRDIIFSDSELQTYVNKNESDEKFGESLNNDSSGLELSIKKDSEEKKSQNVEKKKNETKQKDLSGRTPKKKEEKNLENLENIKGGTEKENIEKEVRKSEEEKGGENSETCVQIKEVDVNNEKGNAEKDEEKLENVENKSVESSREIVNLQEFDVAHVEESIKQKVEDVIEKEESLKEVEKCQEKKDVTAKDKLEQKKTSLEEEKKINKQKKINTKQEKNITEEGKTNVEKEMLLMRKTSVTKVTDEIEIAKGDSVSARDKGEILSERSKRMEKRRIAEVEKLAAENAAMEHEVIDGKKEKEVVETEKLKEEPKEIKKLSKDETNVLEKTKATEEENAEKIKTGVNTRKENIEKIHAEKESADEIITGKSKEDKVKEKVNTRSASKGNIEKASAGKSNLNAEKTNDGKDKEESEKVTEDNTITAKKVDGKLDLATRKQTQEKHKVTAKRKDSEKSSDEKQSMTTADEASAEVTKKLQDIETLETVKSGEEAFKKIEEMLFEMENDSTAERSIDLNNKPNNPEMSNSDLISTLSDLDDRTSVTVVQGKFTALKINLKEASLAGKILRVSIDRLDMEELLKQNIFQEDMSPETSRRKSHEKEGKKFKKSNSSPREGTSSNFLNGKKTGKLASLRTRSMSENTQGNSSSEETLRKRGKLVRKSETDTEEEKKAESSEDNQSNFEKKILRKRRVLRSPDDELSDETKVKKAKVDESKSEFDKSKAESLSENFKKNKCGADLMRSKAEDTKKSKSEETKKNNRDDSKKNKIEDTKKSKSLNAKKIKPEDGKKIKCEDTKRNSEDLHGNGDDSNEILSEVLNNVTDSPNTSSQRPSRVRKINPRYKEAIEEMNLSTSFNLKVDERRQRKLVKKQVGETDTETEESEGSSERSSKLTNELKEEIVKKAINTKCSVQLTNINRLLQKKRETKIIKRNVTSKKEDTDLGISPSKRLRLMHRSEKIDETTKSTKVGGSILTENVLERLKIMGKVRNVRSEERSEVFVTDRIKSLIGDRKGITISKIEKNSKSPSEQISSLTTMRNEPVLNVNKIFVSLKEESKSPAMRRDVNVIDRNKILSVFNKTRALIREKCSGNQSDLFKKTISDTKKLYMLVDGQHGKKFIVKPRFFAFRKIVKNIKSVKLPTKNWQVKLGLSETNKVIQVTCTDTAKNRNVQLSCFKSGYELIFNGKLLKLLGAPDVVDSLQDLSILLNIVNNIRNDDPILELKN